MEADLQDDVRQVLAFMQENVPVDRLIGVALGVASLAPALWGHFPASEVRALSLRSSMSCVQQTRQAAK